MKKKFYATNWFMWLMLILIPPVGLILLWTCHKDMKRKNKILLTVVFFFWLLVWVGANTNSNGESKGEANGDASSQQVIRTYDNSKNVEIKDVINGSRTEKIGEYSIIRVKSADVTEETLTDWYFNYVTKNEYNWCMILYTDKSDNTGVYSINGVVQKDVVFTKDKYGDYSLSEADATANAITYGPTDDGKLEKLR